MQREALGNAHATLRDMCRVLHRVHLTTGPVTAVTGLTGLDRSAPAGYQHVGSKNFEFEFQKLKLWKKSLKILRDLLSLMVSNLLKTSFI
jgi:hypothetical protein